MMQDDTVNAAAVVLAAAARSSTGLLLHHQQVDDHAFAATKPRWWSRVKAKLLCFRDSRHGHPHRIAAASPEPVRQSSSNNYCTHHATQPTTVAFAAPPPSPSSSLFASEAPSPVQVLRLDASSSYSSPTTASMFAVGPYAREPQQLVSPPAFSAGLTEPSTAPLTPPPESAGGLQLLVAGSSPEVPFARFLSPSFQGYQLQPGSPIGGTLVLSPASTSSSPPAWLLHRRDEEEGPSLLEAGGEEGFGARRKPSGEFVFGSAAGEWTTTFADSDGGERRSSTSMADDAAEGGNRQWPFCSSLRS